MRDSDTRASYVGQVERDSLGNLWAVLYFRDTVVTRRRVDSLRRGRKCVSDLVLSAADNFPTGPVSLPLQTGPVADDEGFGQNYISGASPATAQP